ncbi:MAG: hypothetical protein ABSH14_09595 [Verrucomicrobiia bacterium]|jgi:hypothetical protein
MQRKTHRRKRLTGDPQLLESIRIAVADSKQLLRDTKKVIAENGRLRKKLKKLLRNSNQDNARRRNA